LFGVITETPVYCFPHRTSDPNFDSSEEILSLRPLQELRSVHLEEGHGAGLLCDSANTVSWTTGISLADVRFLPTIHGELEDERDAETMYELMKIAGRLRRRDLEREPTGGQMQIWS
jgi:hypothetical protein